MKYQASFSFVDCQKFAILHRYPFYRKGRKENAKGVTHKRVYFMHLRALRKNFANSEYA